MDSQLQNKGGETVSDLGLTLSRIKVKKMLLDPFSSFQC